MTDNLRNRVSLHNHGKVFATKTRIPFSLIYYEAHCDKHDAAKRERFLKTGWGEKLDQKNAFGLSTNKKVGRVKVLFMAYAN